MAKRQPMSQSVRQGGVIEANSTEGCGREEAQIIAGIGSWYGSACPRNCG